MRAKLVKLASLLLLVLPPISGMAQQVPKSQSEALKTEEIAQLVAPIALYPDALLAEVLMASTYPFEVAQAAQFLKNNESLRGQELTDAIEKQDWDRSVKAVAQFPPALGM